MAIEPLIFETEQTWPLLRAFPGASHDGNGPAERTDPPVHELTGEDVAIAAAAPMIDPEAATG